MDLKICVIYLETAKSLLMKINDVTLFCSMQTTKTSSQDTDNFFKNSPHVYLSVALNDGKVILSTAAGASLSKYCLLWIWEEFKSGEVNWTKWKFFEKKRQCLRLQFCFYNDNCITDCTLFVGSADLCLWEKVQYEAITEEWSAPLMPTESVFQLVQRSWHNSALTGSVTLASADCNSARKYRARKKLFQNPEYGCLLSWYSTTSEERLVRKEVHSKVSCRNSLKTCG